MNMLSAAKKEQDTASRDIKGVFFYVFSMVFLIAAAVFLFNSME